MSIEEAMRKAFQLGQIYWQQADSDSYRQQDKSDGTKAKFEELVVEAKGEATELIKALEGAASWLEWLDDPRCGLGDSHKTVIKQARAALKKAAGEQP